MDGDEARAESERQSLRIAAVIFSGGALAAFAAAAVDVLIAPMPGYSAPGMVFFGCTAVVASLAFVVLWWRRVRVPPWAYFTFWVSGVMLTLLGQVLVGSPPSFAPMQAGLLCVFAAAFLPRALSIATVVCFGIGLAVVFRIQDGWEPPLAFWLVAMITTLACSIAVAQLVTRAEVQTSRANSAVDDLQVLNATLEDRVDAQVAEIQASRARIVAVADEERRRMERDLHDGAQQYISLMALQLSRIDRVLDSDVTEARTRLAEVRSTLGVAQTGLRNLAHGIYPAALESEGVAEALRQAVGRSPVPVTVESDGVGRLPREAEAAVYFCCLEALQNVTKHAGSDARASVELAQQGDRVKFAVIDTGVGFDVETGGQGLTNMQDRIGALGGEIRVASTVGAGTSVTGWVPVS